MDASSFDQLIGRLPGTANRRGLLAALASGLLATVARPFVDHGATAKRKQQRKRQKRKTARCASGTKACGRQCIPIASCCTNSDCPAGRNQICQSGTCACAAGQQDSGGVCGIPPTCPGAGEPCGTNPGCCSGLCSIVAPGLECSQGGTGLPCHTSDDCNAGLTCVGFACQI